VAKRCLDLNRRMRINFSRLERFYRSPTFPSGRNCHRFHRPGTVTNTLRRIGLLHQCQNGKYRMRCRYRSHERENM